MKIADHVYPHVRTRTESFGIKTGQIVVDYGCGPGRYTIEMAQLVGASGKVIAVDLVELALEETQSKQDMTLSRLYSIMKSHRKFTDVSPE